GWTLSTNFGTTSGAYQSSLSGTQDAFVTKLNSSGSALLYSTYYGGNASDTGNGITLDSSGNAWVTGSTPSSNFPTTTGAFQGSLSGTQDAFLASFSSSGSLRYSTYYGGSSTESCAAVCAYALGYVFFIGQGDSRHLPGSAGV